jgi:hypothetical protein
VSSERTLTSIICKYCTYETEQLWGLIILYYPDPHSDIRLTWINLVDFNQRISNTLFYANLMRGIQQYAASPTAITRWIFLTEWRSDKGIRFPHQRRNSRPKDNDEKEEKTLEGEGRETFDSIFYRDSRHFSTYRWSGAFSEALDCIVYLYVIHIDSCECYA